jgi:micrococcal nuclease
MKYSELVKPILAAIGLLLVVFSLSMIFIYIAAACDKPRVTVTTVEATTVLPQCPAYVDAAEKPRYLKGMKPYVYPVLSIIDVHDGDSGWVNLDLGFQISRKVCYRLEGLDTPEVTGPQKPVGLAVRAIVVEWMKRAVTCESKSLDKYGRAIVEFYDKDGISLNAYLLDKKLALPYKGESKSVMWSQAELRAASAAAATAAP